MKGMNGIACVLVIVGALNWGLVGIGGFMGADWNVVHMLLGAWPQVEWLVYVLVGIAGLLHIKSCRPNSGMMM
jgi:uncharacterized membrane protein YuzA (DUF378 family)